MNKLLVHTTTRKALGVFLSAFVVLLATLPAAPAAQAQSSQTVTFTGSNLQTYWLPDPGSWRSAPLGGAYTNGATSSDSGYVFSAGTTGRISLGFTGSYNVTAVAVSFDDGISAAECANSYRFFSSINDNVLYDGNVLAGSLPLCGSASTYPVWIGEGPSSFAPGVTNGLNVVMGYGTDIAIKEVDVTLAGCTATGIACFTTSGYGISGGGVGSPNSCVFGDGYTITGQGPLFYICIAQQFILRQIEPPLAAIYERLVPLEHIAYNIGWWLANTGQGAVNWITAGITQFAGYLTSSISASANGVINAILQLGIAIQGSGSGGGGSCGSQGGIFGFLLQLLGCNLIQTLTDLLNTLINAVTGAINNLISSLTSLLNNLLGGLVSVLLDLINQIAALLGQIIAALVTLVGLLLQFAEYLISAMLALFGAIITAMTTAGATSQSTGVATAALSPTCIDPSVPNPACMLMALMDNTIFANPLIPDLFNGLLGLAVLSMFWWAWNKFSGALQAAT